MNRNDYVHESITRRMSEIRESAKVKPDHISRDRDSYSKYLSGCNLNIETDEQYGEARNDYLATCLASDSERSSEMFRDNETLKEINVDYYLGKHDRVRGVISREYEAEDGETIHGHLLIEHTHDNPHLEGIRRMASAYAKATFVDQAD